MHPSKFSIEGLELVKDKLTTPDQFTYKEDGDVQAPVCTPKIWICEDSKRTQLVHLYPYNHGVQNLRKCIIVAIIKW